MPSILMGRRRRALALRLASCRASTPQSFALRQPRGINVYAVIGLAFAVLFVAMIWVQGISALLWTPVGFAFGLFSAAQMILPLLLALPRAIRLVTKRQMRTAVFGRILITPLIWLAGLFIISFLIVFLSPSTAKFLSNNIPLNLGTSLGWVAIILSPLSAKARSDFVADFDKAYQEFYVPNPPK